MHSYGYVFDFVECIANMQPDEAINPDSSSIHFISSVQVNKSDVIVGNRLVLNIVLSLDAAISPGQGVIKSHFIGSPIGLLPLLMKTLEPWMWR